jgi:hypothetical protein
MLLNITIDSYYSLFRLTAWFIVACGLAVNGTLVALTWANRQKRTRHTLGACTAALLAFLPTVQLLVSTILHQEFLSLGTMKVMTLVAVVPNAFALYDGWSMVRKIRQRGSTRSYIMWLSSAIFAGFCSWLYAQPDSIGTVYDNMVTERSVRMVAALLSLWCVVVALYGFVYYLVWFLSRGAVKGCKYELLHDDALLGIELFFKLDYARTPLLAVPVVTGYLLVSLSILTFLPLLLKAVVCGPHWYVTALSPAWRLVGLANMTAALWAAQLGPFVQTLWKRGYVTLTGAIILLFLMLPIHGWLFWASLVMLPEEWTTTPEMRFSCEEAGF